MMWLVRTFLQDLSKRKCYCWNWAVDSTNRLLTEWFHCFNIFVANVLEKFVIGCIHKETHESLVLLLFNFNRFVDISVQFINNCFNCFGNLWFQACRSLKYKIKWGLRLCQITDIIISNIHSTNKFNHQSKLNVLLVIVSRHHSFISIILIMSMKVLP